MSLNATSLLNSNEAASSENINITITHTGTQKPQRKCNWKNWRSEVLHPKEKFRDWNSVMGRTEKVHSVPGSVNSQKPFLLNSYHIQERIWESKIHRYREGATLYNKRGHRVVILPSVGLDLEYPYCDPVRERESEQHLDSKWNKRKTFPGNNHSFHRKRTSANNPGARLGPEMYFSMLPGQSSHPKGREKAKANENCKDQNKLFSKCITKI